MLTSIVLAHTMLPACCRDPGRVKPTARLLDTPIWAIQMQRLLMPVRKLSIQMSKDLKFVKEFHEYIPV